MVLVALWSQSRSIKKLVCKLRFDHKVRPDPGLRPCSGPAFTSKMIIIRNILTALLLLLLSSRGYCADDGCKPYCLIAIDRGTGWMTGYFEAALGLDKPSVEPVFTCRFLFFGVKKGDGWNIMAFTPGFMQETPGRLYFTNADGKEAAQIVLKKDPMGCRFSFGFATGGATVPYKTSSDWKEIRVVRSRKAWLYSEPDERALTRDFMTRDTMVIVYDLIKDWALAVTDGEESRRGWVLEDDLHPLRPGRRRVRIWD